MITDVVNAMTYETKKENVDVINNINNSVLFHTDALVNKLNNINSISDEELRNLVASSINAILTNLFSSKKDTQVYVAAFCNTRFLDALNYTLMNKCITFSEATKLNEVFYNYLISSNPEGVIIKKMYNISSIVNGPMVSKLLGIGINSDLANALVIARFNNAGVDIYVKRINFILASSNPGDVNREAVKRIFTALYGIDVNQYNAVSVLTHFMFDKNYYGDATMQEIDNMLSLAMLDLLNECMDNVIMESIKSYSMNCMYMRKSVNNVRFSLRSLSNEFNRVMYGVGAVLNTIYVL